jgi:CheY-like chemotaxis protein
MSSTEPKHLEIQPAPPPETEAAGRLAEGMTRDLNSLIMLINSYAEMLLAGGEFSEEAAEWLKRIYVAGERAANLTRQLLAAGQQSGEMQGLELNGGTASPTSQLEAPRGKELILVVDDEEPVRALAVLILQKHGYRVLEAASGPEALEVWERHHTRINALITDIVMPGEMTGLELATQLQMQKPSLRIVFTTGYSADLMGDEPDGRQGPCLLQKPYMPRQLALALRTSLDSYEPIP